MCNKCMNQGNGYQTNTRGGFIPLIVGGVIGYGIGNYNRPNYYQYPAYPMSYPVQGPIYPYPSYPYYQQNYYYRNQKQNRAY